MHLRSDLWFKDEGDIVVIGMDMSKESTGLSLGGRTNFAYSITDSVTNGAPFFLIMRTFRGGEGHIRASKSLVWLSVNC